MIWYASIKLKPSAGQAALLMRTLEKTNEACKWLNEMYPDGARPDFRDVQKEHYYNVRRAFGLDSVHALSAIRRFAHLRAKCAGRRSRLSLTGSVPLSLKAYSLKVDDMLASLRLLGSRESMDFVGSPGVVKLLRHDRGEAVLTHRRGKWFLHVSVTIAAPTPRVGVGYLGVDLGVVNNAVDSDGHVYSSAKTNEHHERVSALRKRLQIAGTRSAHRHIVRIAHRSSRHATNEDGRISNEIVARAKGTGRDIAVEDLRGINARTTVRKPGRERRNKWAFRRLRKMITYKAEVAGVHVVAVDPRDTSRTCTRCGHVAAANRQTQNKFTCVRCGFSDHADHVGAVNIQRRAAIIRPIDSVYREGCLPTLSLQGQVTSVRIPGTRRRIIIRPNSGP